MERVSYDVITPSSARAIFESVFWKPAIYWVIKEIQVLAPIRWISVRRNEVSKVASTQSKTPIFIEDDRQQRAGLFLRDVCYRIHAEFVFILPKVPPKERSKSRFPVPEFLLETDSEEYADWKNCKADEERTDETEAKYAAIFERRAKKGQWFHKPYLGCREFAADVKLVNPAVNPAEPIKETRDLGWMLYDMDFDSKNIKPLFFRAEMKNGIISVPARDSDEVRGKAK
ncbi:MAG: type I-C CRISPR-associated protein Cas5c [Planctomycetaceae bacterium]|nr:type I-C CRISPR-associated protein Cas5c [Planctomycetaceae bacterium]